MSLAGAAAAMGLPEALVQRSAEARSAETGQSIDEILAAWAGGEAAPAPPASPPPAEETEATNPEPTVPPAAQTVEPVAIAEVETPDPIPVATTTRAPVPDEVTAGEARHFPEVITVPTAGIKERASFVIPKWLTAVMLVVPLFALFALGGAETGDCGEATELETDVVTGQIVNCDGSTFTGSEVGGGGTDFIALGDTIYNGTAVTGVNCAGCHGANGQGSSTFPPLTGTVTTFGACSDHLEWVDLGSAGFTTQGTYGDTNKPVNGGMPAFGGSLSAEQIAAVSAFERVRFGGADPDIALSSCGLVEEPTGETNTEGGGEDSSAGA